MGRVQQEEAEAEAEEEADDEAAEAGTLQDAAENRRKM